MAGLCSIEGCRGPTEAHGWCSAHYQRWRRHGDPLGGRTSRNEVPNYFQHVVLAYEGDECLIWPYSRSDHGYAQMRLEGKLYSVSRLVCEKTHGPPPTPDHEAAHGCGKGTSGCVTKGHLDWKTSAQNQADKLLHGTDNRGEKHPLSKLTEPEVRQIRALKGKLLQREIAEQFDVDRATIHKIHSEETWGWLNG